MIFSYFDIVQLEQIEKFIKAEEGVDEGGRDGFSHMSPSGGSEVCYIRKVLKLCLTKEHYENISCFALPTCLFWPSKFEIHIL